jgi:hypothetical protein
MYQTSARVYRPQAGGYRAMRSRSATPTTSHRLLRCKSNIA